VLSLLKPIKELPNYRETIPLTWSQIVERKLQAYIVSQSAVLPNPNFPQFQIKPQLLCLKITVFRELGFFNPLLAKI
jgi:hypothetical protein